MTKIQLKEIVRFIVARKLLEAVNQNKYGYIMREPVGNLRSLDPIVQMHGYGNMRLSQWKQKATQDLEDVVKMAKMDNWRNVAYGFKEGSVLNSEINLIFEVDKKQRLEELAPKQTNMYGMSSSNNPLDTTQSDKSKVDSANDTQISPQDQQKMDSFKKQQDGLTDQVRRIDGTIQKLQEPIVRKVKYLEMEKSKLQKKLGTATKGVEDIQAKYKRANL